MKVFIIVCLSLITEASGFIFGCQPVQRFCPLHCPNGFSRDAHGCEMCHCADADPSTFHQDGQHHHIQNPCIPTQAMCPLNCEYYVKGGNGCEFCMCDTSHTTSTTQVSSSTAAPTAKTSVTSQVGSTGAPQKSTTDGMDCRIAAEICDRKCKGEYLTDHRDCTFCVCKSDITNP